MMVTVDQGVRIPYQPSENYELSVCASPVTEPDVKLKDFKTRVIQTPMSRKKQVSDSIISLELYHRLLACGVIKRSF